MVDQHIAWIKVVDAGHFRSRGGQVTPGLANVVELPGPAPATAAPFLVLRAYRPYDGAFTESWHIRDPHGRTVRDALSRELAAPIAAETQGGLADEVEDVTFEYADTGYQLVVEADGIEIARADFEVRERAQGG